MPKLDIPLDTLMEQLHNADWKTRCDAARLLGLSHDPLAVDVLLPDLDDPDWRVRRNAAQALGSLRDPRAVEPLMEKLNDKTFTVRQRAIVALGQIKDLRALPALLEIVLENRRESSEASKAIHRFGKRALPEIAQAFERNSNQQLLKLLIEMNYKGAFDLIQKMAESKELSVRLTGIHQLGTLGDRKAVPYLIGQLNHRNPKIQSEVIRALGQLGATETIPALLDLLKEDELFGRQSDVYHAITEAFQMFGGITEDIENAFPGEYPPMFSVGRAQLSLPEAISFVRNDPSRMLVEALTKLQTGFMDPDEPIGTFFSSVRRTLENMAWKFGVLFEDAKDAKQERVTLLIELLQSELGLKRAAAALSLPWYTDERAQAPLERAAQDPEETVQKAAKWALRALQKSISYRNQFGK